MEPRVEQLVYRLAIDAYRRGSRNRRDRSDRWRGPAADRQFRWGERSGCDRPRNWRRSVAAFSGPYAAAVNVGGYFAAGLVFDPVLNKFLLFQDDGFLYTITKVSMANWAVDRLAVTGVPPTAVTRPARISGDLGRMSTCRI